MSVTSLTTAAAFYANIFSPVMPIKAFGIFAGTLIPMNFFLVVIMMPPAIILFEENFKYKFCFCMKRYTEDGGQELNEMNDPDILNPELTFVSKLIIFFDQIWNSFVFKARYIILIFSVVWFIVACYFTSRMGPQTEQPNFLSDDNPVWKPVAILSSEFPQDAERYSDVTIYWGVGDIDRTGEKLWDPDFIGEISFN